MGFSLSKAVKLGTGGLVDLEGMKGSERGYGEGADIYRQMYEQGRTDLAPYRSFGENYGLNALKGYGKFNAPSMDDVYASPDYNLGLKTIENSAAARGGLMSGNFLRSAQDYAGSIYDREYSRRMAEYQNELNRLMGYTNLGYGAAGGSAGLASSAGNALAGLRVGEGEARTNRAQYPLDILSGVGGFLMGKG